MRHRQCLVKKMLNVKRANMILIILGVTVIEAVAEFINVPKDADLVVPKCPKSMIGNSILQLILPHRSCYKFYRCYRGQAVERTCPLGLFFNDHILRCDFQHKVNCSSRPLPKNIKLTVIDESGTGSATGSNEASTTHDNLSLNDTVEGITGIANYNTSNNTLKNKDYYYVHWSSVSSGADDFKPPVSDMLDEVSSGEKSDPKQNELDDNDVDYKSSGGQLLEIDKSFLPNGCPRDPAIHWQIPHRLNCSLYFECYFGKIVEKNCGDHLQYNPRLQVCDWPMDAKCQTVQSILLKYQNKMLERRRKLSKILMRP